MSQPKEGGGEQVCEMGRFGPTGMGGDWVRSPSSFCGDFLWRGGVAD
jgi:hypothetical protein